MLPPNAASLALTKVYLLKWLAHLSLMEEEYFDVQASNASDGTPNIVLGPRPVESVMECRQSR